MFLSKTLYHLVSPVHYDIARSITQSKVTGSKSSEQEFGTCTEDVMEAKEADPEKPKL